MALERELPPTKEYENATEYRQRVNKDYQDVCLKCMMLEEQNKRIKQQHEQTTKNAVAEAKKELYDKYQEKAEHMEELEREFGSFTEIADKCESFDNLLIGIAKEEESKEDIVNIVNTLINNGKKQN